MSAYLSVPDIRSLPYCKGCGHHHVARETIEALEALQVDPLNTVLVSDIGCQGIIDRCLKTHTVHGLHGRSVALAAGIAMNLPTNKKVVAFMGDGGATIGLQHLLEAARLNVNLTVVVHNNMLYGMTGGQPSGLTPLGFRTVITPEGSKLPSHDLCQLVYDAGAPYARRVVSRKDMSDALREALAVEGFALVEVLEFCIAYGQKKNPNLKLPTLARQVGYELKDWQGETRDAFHLPFVEDKPSLLTEIEIVKQRFASSLKGRLAVVMGGSAGEGVQKAAQLLARAAIASGLNTTRKGSYPVTVGVGFSTAEVLLSRDPITYHGISQPDVAIITSQDGLGHNLQRIRNMDRGTVWLDESLPQPETGAEVRVQEFRERAGTKNAALCSLLTFVRESEVVPIEALIEVVRESDIGQRVSVDFLENCASV